MTIELNEQWTGIAALLTILLGARINRAVPVFSTYSIPPAVTGGLLIAVLLAVAGTTLGWKVTFADTLRNALLLIFFAALGLTARFRRLKTGGAAVAGLCVLIALLATLQSVAGAAIAHAFGRPPALGVFLGSVPFLGGHGTTVAWAQSPLASGLPHALEIGMVCATIGLVAGAVISGVVGTRLAKRPASGSVAAGSAEPAEPDWPQSPFDSDRWIVAVLWIALAVALGLAAQPIAARMLGGTVPAFLAVLLAAVVLTNVADLARRPLDLVAIDLVGTLALRVFLAIAMLGLQLAAVGDSMGLIFTAAAVQVILAVTIAVLGVYPLLKGRDGAIGAAGFVGFGLGAMPVGLAAMKRLSLSYGDAPRAFLVITLAASLFTDTANALIVQALLTRLAP
ncbi:MAG TPA: sodium/glutamate symporter [Burkholderiaceae bacterium]|nr:sodium/glutamate symporter [Burkholderiaceae bacterium]